MNGPYLKGDQISLRPIRPADNRAIVRWRNSVGARKGFYAQPRATIASQQAWYRRYLTDPDDVRFIVEASGDRAVGICGLTGIRRRERTAHLTILLAEPSTQGRGLGRAVLAALFRYGFGRLRLRRITAEVFESNTAAQKLYSSVGFVEEGRLRAAHRDPGSGRIEDVIVMGLLPSEAGRSV